mgnify:FL=1
MSTGKSVVAIGIFDGVHIGHQRILEQARLRAKELGVEAIALTFDPHPTAILAPEHRPNQLTTLNYRARLIKSIGIDAMVALTFDQRFANLSPAEFEQDILINQLDVQAIYVGDNFTYGHKALGTVESLKESKILSNREVHGEPLTVFGGETVSSTLIRKYVHRGNVEHAWKLLTRPHVVEGTVVHGDARGRELGYPTANFGFTYPAAIPADGVYAGWLHADGESWPAAISIGTNPTFNGADRRVEAHALGRTDLELYGKSAAISFGWRLRETLKFDGISELLIQMKLDCDRASELTASSSSKYL